jgi:hypothetical protein
VRLKNRSFVFKQPYCSTKTKEGRDQEKAIISDEDFHYN